MPIYIHYILYIFALEFVVHQVGILISKYYNKNYFYVNKHFRNNYSTFQIYSFNFSFHITFIKKKVEGIINVQSVCPSPTFTARTTNATDTCDTSN